MATVSKIIYQGILTTAYAGATTAIPSGHVYQITHVHFNNYTALTVTVSADNNGDFVEWFSGLRIEPHKTYDWYPRDLVLSPGQSLELKASAGSSIQCSVFGKDIT